MKKPLRILDDVVDRDVPAIVAYRWPRSRKKAEAVVAEYDRVIELLKLNPFAFRERASGWS